jgi:hypothetical protein
MKFIILTSLVFHYQVTFAVEVKTDCYAMNESRIKVLKQKGHLTPRKPVAVSSQ